MVAWVVQSHPHACLLAPGFLRTLGYAVNPGSGVGGDMPQPQPRPTTQNVAVRAPANGVQRHPVVDLLKAVGVRHASTLAQTWMALSLQALAHASAHEDISGVAHAAHACVQHVGPWVLQAISSGRREVEKQHTTQGEAANVDADAEAEGSRWFLLMELADDVLRVSAFVAGLREGSAAAAAGGAAMDMQLCKSCCLLALQLTGAIAGVRPFLADSRAASTDRLASCCWWRSNAGFEYALAATAMQQESTAHTDAPSISSLMDVWNRLELQAAASWQEPSPEALAAAHEQWLARHGLRHGERSEVVEAATKAIAATASAVSKATTSYVLVQVFPCNTTQANMLLRRRVLFPGFHVSRPIVLACVRSGTCSAVA